MDGLRPQLLFLLQRVLSLPQAPRRMSHFELRLGRS
ncbi:hypothetical protein LUTEI9C_100054 [Luteimonas sp. 9C]|nr:hypothetical protein LUTEI9C_100054 [Luteimonas sp. 9C]